MKKRDWGPWIRLGIVVVVLAAGGVVFLRWVQAARRKEAVALAGHREEAAAMAGAIGAAADRAAAKAKEAREGAALVTNDYAFVTGEPAQKLFMTDGAVPLEASGPLAITQRTGPKPQKPAPGPTAATPAVDAGGEPLPDGLTPKEQLDRRRAREKKRESEFAAPEEAPKPAQPAEKPPEPPPEKPAEKAGEKPEEPGAAAGPDGAEKPKPAEPPPKPEPDIRDLTRSAVMSSRTISDKSEALRMAATEANRLHREIAAVGKAEAALHRVVALRKVAQTAEADIVVVDAEAAQVTAAVTAVQGMRRQIEERREKARQESERRQKLAEQRALVQKEMALVSVIPEDNRALVKGNEFDQALRITEGIIAGLKTDEARAAARAVADRYVYLSGLKSFLVERLNAQPFQWGWGFGAAALDIVGATDVEIKLKQKAILWSSVGMPQMVKIIDNYISDKSLQIRVRAKQNLAAAILCEEQGLPDAMTKYQNRAVELSPALKEDVARLFKAR
jgi:hypothetical protein